MDMKSLVKFDLVILASISIIMSSCSLHVSLLRSRIAIHSTAYYKLPAPKNGLGTITGFVTTDDSAAVFGATIELLDIGDRLLRKADVDSFGTFKIVNIPPGLYTINVFDIGYEKATLNNLEIKANAIIHVEVHLIAEEAHFGMEDKLRARSTIFYENSNCSNWPHRRHGVDNTDVSRYW